MNRGAIERIIDEVIKFVWIPVVIGIATASLATGNWKLGLTIFLPLTPIYILGRLYYNERKKTRALGLAGKPQEPDAYIRDVQLYADEDIIDHSNRYKLIRFEAFIDREGSYHAKYRKVGINVGNAPIQYLLVKTATDSNVAYEETYMSAKDLKTGKELKIDPYSDVRFQKKCRIFFMMPVPIGGEFDIEWSFIWPRVMRKPADFDGFNISRFCRGINRLELELIFEWTLRSWALWEIKGNLQKLSSRDPRWSIDNIGRNHYMWWCDNPTADSIIFSYML